MTKRYEIYKPPFEDRNRAGEKICVMCGKPLIGRKLRWCGDKKCFQLKWLRSGDQAAMRRYLLKRDKGVCAGCGLHAELLREVLEYALECMGGDRLSYQWLHDSEIEFRQWCKGKGIPCGFHYQAWEAHHIIPVSDGGQHHEDNLQILCLNCHHSKGKTNKND